MTIARITGMSKTASAGKWKRIGERKRAGILAPLFSV